MVLLSPSILSADFSRLGDAASEAEKGGADWLHVDVMDGMFVPNITVGPIVVEALKRRTALPLDVHLMIEDPDRYIEAFAKAGASYITVHVEACPHLHRTLNLIRSYSVKAGVAVNPATPAGAVESILDDIDLLLIMTVNPGFGGQSFIRSVVPKVGKAKAMLGARKVHIEVDGGITVDTAPLVVNEGADALVAGNAVFRGKGSVAENIAVLRNCCSSSPLHP